MITVQTYFLLLLFQVTAISVVAIAMSFLARKSAVQRHTIALTGLTLVLISPLATWLLPLRWHALVSSSGISVSEISLSDNLLPLAADIAPNVETPTNQESSTTFNDSNKPATRPVPRSSATRIYSDSRLDPSDTEAIVNSSSKHPPDEIEVAAINSSKLQLGGMTVDQQSGVVPTEAQDMLLESRAKFWGLVCLLSVWFGGAIFCGARLFSRRRQFYLAVKPLQRLSIEALSASIEHRLRTTLGVRDLPNICTSQSIPSPVVLGVLRPVVVLPETLISELSEDDLTSVLIHECAHIVRRDHWVHVLQQIAGIVWWFHPGVLMLNQVLARSREEVCDNYVLRHSSPVEFARTLLELTERCGSVRPALSLLGLFGRRWSLETRVTELLNPRRNMMLKTDLRWTTVVVSVMCACCLIVGGVSAVQVDEPSSQSANPANANSSAESFYQDEKPQAATESSSLKQEVVSGLTLRGECRLLGSDKPVRANVRVFLLRNGYYAEPKLLGELRSDETGQFTFNNLDLEDAESEDDRFHIILAIATAPGYSSAMEQAIVGLNDKIVDDLILELSGDLATLSGTITDANGNPVKGATVFLQNGSLHAIAGFRSAITDFSGRYEITDLKQWKDIATFDKGMGTGTQAISVDFFIQHPDFPHSEAKYTELPQVVDVTLQPPAIIEGQVMDLVTGAPVPDVPVQAEGIARGGWHEVRTDKDGRYILRVTRDHYNIWAIQKDRMPLAIKAFEAEPGVRSAGRDIHMVRGGFVTGRVLTVSGDPAPISGDYVNLVAHYGPSRPRTGAAVSTTMVNADGMYRIHVAPGRNYIHSMDHPAAAYVDVGDGQEVELDLSIDPDPNNQFKEFDEDYLLRGRLLYAAMLEDQATESLGQTDHRPGGQGIARNATKPASGLEASSRQSRIRRSSPTGLLLNKLEDMKGSPWQFKEQWAEVLRQIVNLGPDAVPALIEELDATNDEHMLRCLGFSLRAIGDKRAIPALIRAIPKTLRPSASDLGLRIENNEMLQQFMQKHDLDESNTGNCYGFGLPIREIFGALQTLSGQKFNEEELYFIYRSGFPSQIFAKEKLFHRKASQWRDWWELVGSAEVDDPRYKKVHLEPLAETKSLVVANDGMLKTSSGGSGYILESIRKTQAWPRQFYDLDTGRFANLPEQWNRESLSADDVAAILNWAADEGFDIMGDEYIDSDGNAIFAIRTIGLQAWQLDDTRWKSLPAEFTVEELKAEGQRVTDDWLLHRDPESGTVDPQQHAAFLFVTREGTPGVIYVGIPVIDDSLQPGGYIAGDRELDPVAFEKGRRFGFDSFVPNNGTP